MHDFLGPELEAVMNELRHIVDKVNEMQKQRAMLSQQLRESIYQDDILRRVVTYNGENLQELFDSELQKHQRIVSLIEQNLAAQDNIIKAAKDVYAKYGAIRKDTSDMRRGRDAMIASLIASYDAYEDLLAKSSKGLDFYKKLEVNVSKLLQRVKGTCKVQDEEREQIIKNVKSSESHETPPPNPLKLKDYLEMKKEFGKLSLDNAPVQAANAYYKPTTLNEHAPNQSRIPGVRPAPVGSEETDPSRMDSFSGLGQGHSRDQTWSNPPYSSNIDDRMKYYAPQAPASSEARYPTDASSAASMPQDIYPISAYSSVMQNTSSTGYTGPKSNYYNTQNSPSRYINPPDFYSDYNQPVVTSYSHTQIPVSTSQYVAETVAPAQPSTYGYSYHASVPSQSGYTTAGFPNQTEVPASTYSQLNYQYPVSGENKPDAGPNQTCYTTYSSGQVDPYVLSQPSVVTSQVYSQYNSYTLPDSSKLSGYSPGFTYSNAVTPQPTNFSSQEAGYITSQPYQVPATPAAYTAASDEAVKNYYNPDAPNLPQSYSKFQGPYAVQQYPDNFNVNWQQSYSPSDFQPSQHLQSGNESLYTACQTNNYSLTNSAVYKNDTQFNQGSCSDQYYVNQYGSCNGQSEFGLNYGNAATYMQAGTDKQQATTTTTYSNSDAKSSPSSEHSNVDLLAGLDFNVSHSPLVPESTAAAADAKPKTEKPAEKVDSKPVETQTKESAQEKDSIDVKKLKKEQPPPPQPAKDFNDMDKLNQDVEKYEKFVESLTLKTLNGPTCLDLKWKEISDLQV